MRNIRFELLLLQIEGAVYGEEIRIDSFVGICRGLVDLERIALLALERGVRIYSENESWFQIERWESDFKIVMMLFHEYKRRYGAQAVAKALSIGNRPGRSKGIANRTVVAMKKAMHILQNDPYCPICKVCKQVGISTNTFNRYRSMCEQVTI